MSVSRDPLHPSRLDDRKLDSWKEIADYLDREVRTVQRWEKTENLPVHRHEHQKKSTVYAFTSELDDWRNDRQPKDDPEADEAWVPESVDADDASPAASPLARRVASSEPIRISENPTTAPDASPSTACIVEITKKVTLSLACATVERNSANHYARLGMTAMKISAKAASPPRAPGAM